MSDRLTAAQIAEIEARAMAATPGEWRIRDGEGLWWTVEAELPSINGLPCWYALARFDFDRAADGYTDGALRPKDDAALLLHARTDIPALVRDLRAAQAECETMKQDALRLFREQVVPLSARAQAAERDLRAAREALAGLLDACKAVNEGNGTQMVDPHAEAAARAALPEETPNG